MILVLSDEEHKAYQKEYDSRPIRKAKRKGAPLNQWLITNNFPNGFQILCWNCNFAKGSPAVSFKCPHQK